MGHNFDDPEVQKDLKNASFKIQKGASGGYRVIYYIQTSDLIILTNIYSKSDYENIDDDAIEKSIKKYLENNF